MAGIVRRSEDEELGAQNRAIELRTTLLVSALNNNTRILDGCCQSSNVVKTLRVEKEKEGEESVQIFLVTHWVPENPRGNIKEQMVRTNVTKANVDRIYVAVLHASGVPMLFVSR